MELRGITFNRESIRFSINDGPVMISEDVIALTNRPNSPLLQANSIARGNENSELFENDFVFTKDHKLLGHIVYNNGFKIKVLKSDLCVPFNNYNKDDYIILENTGFDLLKMLEPYKQPIRFKTGDFAFTLKRVLRVDGDSLIITNKLLKPINLSNVKMCCGLIAKDGSEIGFGDFVGNGTVVCYKNRPMIKTVDGGYRDFGEEEIKWDM